MSDKKLVVANLTVFGLSHAAIDAISLGLVIGLIGSGSVTRTYGLMLAVLYNIFAFALQAPIGYFIDRTQRALAAGLAGLAMLALAVLSFILAWPEAVAVFAGLGNALFHVCGGVYCLNLIPGKAGPPGVYVAPGAIGVLVGVGLGRAGIVPVLPYLAAIIIIAAAIWLAPKPFIAKPSPLKATNYFEIAVLLLFISVAIRGLVGMAVVYPWKSALPLAVILTLAVVAGKALGGWLGDRFGWMRVSLSSLAVATPLVSFFPASPVLAITGAFLFNITMPITLTAIANILPGRAGFAFGLTTLALVIGALPTFFPHTYLGQTAIFISIIVSLITIYSGLRIYQRWYGAARAI